MEAGTYLLGDTDHELARLARQAAIFSDATADILRRAGIGAGMRVLDVGCGVGDVAMLAAGLVGPTGTVVGIDRSPVALETARARATLAGVTNIRFQEADLHDLGDDAFDAVVGRFILMHLPDPAASLRRLVRTLRPGGILAFVEMDIGSANVVPRSELFARCLSLITTVYRKGGMEPDMGSLLYGSFRAAGLDPSIKGSCRIEAGPDALAYHYLADSLRSLLPSMILLGLATEADIGVDTLADRLRAESLANDLCFIFPLTVGAWARLARA
jgi:ubiquinone/menaquinone biosynthesis C-methylase UbiE